MCPHFPLPRLGTAIFFLFSSASVFIGCSLFLIIQFSRIPDTSRARPLDSPPWMGCKFCLLFPFPYAAVKMGAQNHQNLSETLQNERWPHSLWIPISTVFLPSEDSLLYFWLSNVFLKNFFVFFFFFFVIYLGRPV